MACLLEYPPAHISQIWCRAVRSQPTFFVLFVVTFATARQAAR